MIDYSLEAFDYNLPEEKIAYFPVHPKDAARLLIYRNGLCEHGFHYRDLPKVLKTCFSPNLPLLVFNNSKVFKARLIFETKDNKQIEIFLLRPASGDFFSSLNAGSPSEWETLIRRPSRWKKELVLQRREGQVLITAERSGGLVKLNWNPADISLLEILDRIGEVPLPPYIKRKASVSDVKDYQTSYAEKEGSVAAPTAGLHFTAELMKNLADVGININYVTLHVGDGTFAPVRETEDIRKHRMHAEYFSVPLSTLEKLSQWDGPIIPVGTTSLRTLESLYWLGLEINDKGKLPEMLEQCMPYNSSNADSKVSYKEAVSIVLSYVKKMGWLQLTGQTSLYIVPGYKIRSSDGIITNFHQPRSTLLMLIYAFTGADWRKIYEEALSNDYRFLSYGDGMMIINPRI